MPSVVDPSYAPSGSHLVSATVVGNSLVAADELLAAVRKQLAEWFGRDVLGSDTCGPIGFPTLFQSKRPLPEVPAPKKLLCNRDSMFMEIIAILHRSTAHYNQADGLRKRS